MDQILRRATSQINQNTRPTMDLVTGNDKTFKMLLASKLVDAKMPLDFDHTNGITILAGELGQVTVLGSNEHYIAQMEQLMDCNYRYAIAILSLKNPSQTVDYLKQWLQMFKSKNNKRIVIISDWESIKVQEPQTVDVTIQYIRQLCSLTGSQFFTLFNNNMLFDILPLILQNANDLYQDQKNNVIDKKTYKYYVIVPEPHSAEQFQKIGDLFRQHVYQPQKKLQSIENLDDYFSYIEQSSKCGRDFDQLVAK